MLIVLAWERGGCVFVWWFLFLGLGRWYCCIEIFMFKERFEF